MSAFLPLNDERWVRALVEAGNPARLVAFRKKLSNGERIVYGAIGGSITEGASASSFWRRYPSVFASWLDSQAPCELVNAGIGASNSLFGSFRVGKDLLSRNPDIITIEYAVNDLSNPDTAGSFESLVRQCVSQPQKPLVVIIFTMKRDGTNFQDLHASIGHHYALPMISYRDALYPEIAKGMMKWTDISPDEVHPNDLGHAFIGELLKKFISSAPTRSAPEAALPKRLDESSVKYDGGRIIDASAMELISCGGWGKGPHKGGYLGLQSEIPGSLFELAFEGSLVIIGHQQYAGPFGRASVSIDGGKPEILEGFYEKPPIQAWAGGHTVLRKLAEGLKPGRHTLRVELLNERHADSSGHKFDVGYLLVS